MAFFYLLSLPLWHVIYIVRMYVHILSSLKLLTVTSSNIKPCFYRISSNKVIVVFGRTLILHLEVPVFNANISTTSIVSSARRNHYICMVIGCMTDHPFNNYRCFPCHCWAVLLLTAINRYRMFWSSELLINSNAQIKSTLGITEALCLYTSSI